MQSLKMILLVLLGLLVLIMGSILAYFLEMAKRGKSAAGFQIKRDDIEDLLFIGKAAAARTEASRWRRAQPRNPAAYLLLAKAHFQLKELVETKGVLEELIEFSPESEFAARPYLERVEQSLVKNRPRVVD
jgi:hypothetical protein